MQVDMSVYCSPAMCGHVTTYHVIYMCYRYENNMLYRSLIYSVRYEQYERYTRDMYAIDLGTIYTAKYIESYSSYLNIY